MPGLFIHKYDRPRKNMKNSWSILNHIILKGKCHGLNKLAWKFKLQ
jgi:hypothetical protein